MECIVVAMLDLEFCVSCLALEHSVKHATSEEFRHHPLLLCDLYDLDDVDFSHSQLRWSFCGEMSTMHQ